MFELDFTNADIVLEDMLIYTNSIYESSNIKIDSSAIILNEIETDEDIKANYSLVVFRNVRAKRITILKDMICFGSIKCDTLSVTGNLKCFKDVIVGDVQIGNDAYINSGTIKRNSRVEGNLYIGQTINVEANLIVGNNVYCNEGIIGSGNVNCNSIIANDYLEVATSTKGQKIILDNSEPAKEDMSQKKVAQPHNEMSNALITKINRLYEKSQTSKNNKYLELGTFINDKEILNLLNMVRSINRFYKEAFEEFITRSESSMEFEKISQLIGNSKRFIPSLKEDHNIFSRILEWSNKKPERDITSFLKVVEMRRQTPNYLLKLSICEDFFEIYVEREKLFIDEMRTSCITNQQQLVNNLTLLEQNKGQFTEEEYSKILDKLYSVIGIKLDMVKKFISMGG